jgi:hypothetical protein
MGKSSKSSGVSAPVVAKPPRIIAPDQDIDLDGKIGKIIWVGSTAYDKDVKIRWADGTIEFFSSKELN